MPVGALCCSDLCSCSFVGQSNRSERNEVLPLVQKLEERQYENVSEVAEAARMVQS